MTVPSSAARDAPATRTHERRVYFMIKPPLAVAQRIDDCRRTLGLDRGYAVERLHVTLAPLGASAGLVGWPLDLACDAAGALRAEPFELRFHKLSGNALSGGAMPGLRRFQRDLAWQLMRAGLFSGAYAFRPHISLIYGEPQARSLPIEPIAWRADEFLLIESIPRERRHRVLGRWPLVVRQQIFDF